MQRKFICKTVSLCLGLCIFLSLISGCGKEEETIQEISDATNVTVYHVAENSINATTEYTGEVVGAESTTVSAKVSGEAKTIYVKEGDYVTAGTTLLTVDTTSYQLAYNQALAAYNNAVSAKKSAEASKKNAEASYNSVTGGSTQQTLAQLESALNAAKIVYDNALDTYNKNKTLFEMGAISEVEFNSYKTALDNAKLNYDTAQTNYNLTKNVVTNESKAAAQAGVDVAAAGVDSAQSGIQSAKAALDIAANNLSNCTVVAPISGYISSKTVSKGQMVSAGLGLFSITNTASVDVQIHVTEAVIPMISVGTKATIAVSSAGIKNLEGTVSTLNPVKDAATGLYSVKISIPNDNGVLKEGMIANLVLVTESESNTITVPSEALMQSDEDGYYVYVAKGDTAEKRVVEVGIEGAEFTEIISGVGIDDSVIVSGKEYLSEENNKIHIVAE